MKKCYVLFAMLILSTTTIMAQDANVALSNLSSNNYYAEYDENTMTVNDLAFTVTSDGNNSTNIISDFVVKAYLWAQPEESGQDPVYVATFNIEDMPQMTARDYEVEQIDLSGQDIPDGTYRLGLHVDANDDIANPPDDPDDNAYLIEAGNGDNEINISGDNDGGSGQPDLIVQDISYDYDAASGELYNIEISVENTGDADAGSSDIEILIEDQTNGGSFSVAETMAMVPASSGIVHAMGAVDISDNPNHDADNTYSLTVTADHQNTIEESSEDNNTYEINDISATVSGTHTIFIEHFEALSNPVSSHELKTKLKRMKLQQIKINDISGRYYTSAARLRPGIYFVSGKHKQKYYSVKVVIR